MTSSSPDTTPDHPASPVRPTTNDAESPPAGWPGGPPQQGVATSPAGAPLSAPPVGPPHDPDDPASWQPAPKPGRRRSRRRSLLRELIPIAIMALLIYLAFSFALQTVRVDGTSMVHTLQDGDLLMLDKLSYRFHGPERGDIVVVQIAHQDQPFIKRVIAGPGDTVQIDPGDASQSGGHPPVVIVTPQGGSQDKLVEPYLPDPWVQREGCCQADGTDTFTPQPQPLSIPPDRYFVLGDNRNASKDSRFVGLVARDQVLGRAWFRFWPLSHFGGFAGGPSLVAAAAVVPVPGVLGFVRRRRSGVDEQAGSPR